MEKADSAMALTGAIVYFVPFGIAIVLAILSKLQRRPL